jgi:predicted ATPase
MMGRLLERDAELGTLREALDRAGRGRGSVVLVSGEAGIGKTSLVRAFAAAARPRARVLAGGCDDLGTPRARQGDLPAHIRGGGG